jgi:allantoin racemase
VRVLIINPNTSQQMTEAIHRSGTAAAARGTSIETVCATAGPRSIEGYYDEATSLLGSLEWLLRREPDFDAFIFACYSNHPAIHAARELTGKPALGIAEASMVLACLLGHKFSVVTTSPRWKPLLEDAVLLYGFRDRCASVRASGLAVLDLDMLSPGQIMDRLVAEARRAIEDDGAEVICLGCAGMAGLDARIRAELNVPVVDGVAAAVKLAESLVSLGLGTSRVNTYRPVQPRDTDNVPEPFRTVYTETPRHR